jgi:hypothetical protein
LDLPVLEVAEVLLRDEDWRDGLPGFLLEGAREKLGMWRGLIANDSIKVNLLQAAQKDINELRIHMWGKARVVAWDYSLPCFG